MCHCSADRSNMSCVGLQGVLRQRGQDFGGCWLQLLDEEEHRQDGESYWPVSMSASELHCIVCPSGGVPPVHPRPVHHRSVIPFIPAQGVCTSGNGSCRFLMSWQEGFETRSYSLKDYCVGGLRHIVQDLWLQNQSASNMSAITLHQCMEQDVLLSVGSGEGGF